MILEGDCVERMRELPESSVDAIVTDPPYHLIFMGRSWDHAPSPAESQEQHHAWAVQALRVLKPGGHLLAFGGTRTYHRLACAIEDAGFEIRDCLVWMYGSGFPKSLDVSKAIDKAADCPRCKGVGFPPQGGEKLTECPDCHGTGKATRPVTGSWKPTGTARLVGGKNPDGIFTDYEEGELKGEQPITAPATPEATQWEGWGTALKPAHEPIVLARKPLIGTVAANVLEHGTGALNIDGCRIEGGPSEGGSISGETALGQGSGWNAHNNRTTEIDRSMPDGRWPANAIFDETAAEMLDEQSGERPGMASQRDLQETPSAYFGADKHPGYREGFNDSGGASRFFLTVKPDMLCVLCGLPCVESVGNPSPPSTASSDSAQSDAQDSPPHGSEDKKQSDDTSASGAESSSPSTSAIPTAEMDGATAPPDAAEPLADWIVQLASSAESLCNECATSTARSVALWLTDPTQASEVGAASTLDHGRQTLSRNLALIAEGSRTTGITPTTNDLSSSFGSALRVIGSITQANYSEPDRVRFRYQSKSGRGERNAGLDGFEERAALRDGARFNSGGRTQVDGEWVETGSEPQPKANVHPTVKPIDLMRWLVRLVTPPNGTVLDPFMGSGTTGIAAALEGFNFIGIEREAEYAAIARARIEWWSQFQGEDTDEILIRAGLSERIEREHFEAGQLGLEL